MGEWETATVGKINRFVGKTVNPTKTPDDFYELYSVPSWDSGTPEIIQGKQIGSTKVSVNDGDVLVCKINPRINRVWIVQRRTNYPLIASSEWIVIRNNDIDSKFLLRYFESPKFRDLLVSEQSGIGGSLTRAQPKQVQRYPVPLPPLAVQEKIADVLDRAAALIEKRKAQIAKLDLLVKAKFVTMFGDPVTNPMGWEVKKVGDVLRVRSSKRVYQREQTSNGIPFLRVSDLADRILGQGNTADLFISEELYEDYKNSGLVPKQNDILVTSRGTLGLCYIIGATDRFYFQDGMISWLDNSGEKAEAVFVAHIFQTEMVKRQIIKMSAGSTVDYLSLGNLSKIEILLPPSTLQHRFASFVHAVENTKSEIQRGLSRLEILYKSLMQKCFNGEVFA